MKSLLLVVMLAVAATVAVAASAGATEVSNEAPQVPEDGEVKYLYDADGVPKLDVPESRQSITLGVVGPDDRLMAKIAYDVDASAFVTHDQDITWRGVKYTNITAIQVLRVGGTPHATPTIQAGGLGHTFVTDKDLFSYREGTSTDHHVRSKLIGDFRHISIISPGFPVGTGYLVAASVILNLFLNV